jgi:CitMHS family citrate-Mg2+:H+ or citrate-Ca2+:H+ symporter
MTIGLIVTLMKGWVPAPALFVVASMLALLLTVTVTATLDWWL